MADCKVRDQIEMFAKVARFTNEDLRSTNVKCFFCDVFYSEFGEYPFSVINECGNIAFISAQIAKMHNFNGFCLTDCDNFVPVKIKG